jgi:ribosomal protein S27AE
MIAESRYPGEIEEQTEPSITCPRCGATSHNPNDVRELYCGGCHVFLRDGAQQLLVDWLPTDDAQHAARMQYIYLRTLPDGRYLAVEPALWGKAYLKLCGDDSLFGIDNTWEYQERACAVHAAATWDPSTAPEPFGWYRHFDTGRRRAHGNPKNEYVTP